MTTVNRADTGLPPPQYNPAHPPPPQPAARVIMSPPLSTHFEAIIGGTVAAAISTALQKQVFLSYLKIHPWTDFWVGIGMTCFMYVRPYLGKLPTKNP